MTPALRVLAASGIKPELHTYKYIERGGTQASSGALDIEEHRIVKTLIFETNTGQPLVVLMHGDRMVSNKALARQVGVRSVKPCNPAIAQKHSGYRVGGTSPFGLRKPLPVYVEQTILTLDWILINAGRRGLLMHISPSVLTNMLQAQPICAAIAK